MPNASAVTAVRRFNRFYTRQLGLLNEGLYESDFSLSQVRVLYELAHRERPSASQLGKDLGLDPGYLSRILRGLEKQALLSKNPSKEDGRQLLLSLTDRGREVFGQLNDSSDRQIEGLLKQVSPSEQKRLVAAMSDIETTLGENKKRQGGYVLRPHQPGDMGWLVYRHGVLYSQEYGYDERFEALVAKIASEFIENLDPKRERCWIAEKDGENVGCVLLVKKSKTVAKLRVLLVEPSARGVGIGKRLVEECVRFARHAQYKKIMLWTQSELHGARRIYQQTGFRLVGKQRHDSWSRKGLVAETWELKL